jgi:hypothetical protein
MRFIPPLALSTLLVCLLFLSHLSCFYFFSVMQLHLFKLVDDAETMRVMRKALGNASQIYIYSTGYINHGKGENQNNIAIKGVQWIGLIGFEANR